MKIPAGNYYIRHGNIPAEVSALARRRRGQNAHIGSAFNLTERRREVTQNYRLILMSHAGNTEHWRPTDKYWRPHLALPARRLAVVSGQMSTAEAAAAGETLLRCDRAPIGHVESSSCRTEVRCDDPDDRPTVTFPADPVWPPPGRRRLPMQQRYSRRSTVPERHRRRAVCRSSANGASGEQQRRRMTRPRTDRAESHRSTPETIATGRWRRAAASGSASSALVAVWTQSAATR